MLGGYLNFVWTLVIWTSGLPPAFWKYTAPWTAENIGEPGSLKYDFVQGIMLMFFVKRILEKLLSVPLTMIAQFMIADAHGFNNQDLNGFIQDEIKDFIIWAVMDPLQTFILLWILNKFGIELFVFYAGIFVTIFIMLMMVIYPLVIDPLYNHFEPIEDNKLKKDIEAVAEDCNYPISNIEIVDGSSKSSHSNAYQQGFGKVKKIVLYDSLLE